MGMEPPLVGMGLGATARLVDTSVAAVTGWAAEDGVGGVFRRDFVRVNGDQPTLLSPSLPTDLESNAPSTTAPKTIAPDNGGNPR